MNGKQLKNSILQWAIQGKLVPQDPNDEPASVLLDKIRKEKERLVKEKKIKRDKNASIIYRGDDNSYYEKVEATGEVKCIDEEIPFEVPQGWEWTRVGNIFNHASGKQQSSSNKSGGTPQKFITTSNLYWGHFVLDNVKVMNFTEEEIKNCSATKGDLLVCEGGAGYGRSAIWNEDYDICLQNHVHRLRPCFKGICEYVYYFIYLLKESNNLASVGTAMPGLSANRLKGLLLPLPPIKVQQRIVEKLKLIMPVVEKYDKVQTELNELNVTVYTIIKKSILQEAIQGKLVPQIKEEGTANQLLEVIKKEKQRLVKEGKLKKSALNDSVIFKGDDNRYYEKIGKSVQCIDEEIPFEIPESWAWVRWGNISLSIQYGYNAPALEHGVIKMVRISDIQENKVLWDSVPYCIIEENDIETYLLKENDILFARTGGTVGKSFLVDNVPERAIYAGYLIRTRYSSMLNSRYMKMFMESQLYWEQLKNGTIATAQPNCNGKTLAKMLLPIPPLAEQKRIVEKVNLLMQLLK